MTEQAFQKASELKDQISTTETHIEALKNWIEDMDAGRVNIPSYVYRAGSTFQVKVNREQFYLLLRLEMTHLQEALKDLRNQFAKLPADEPASTQQPESEGTDQEN